MTTAEKLANLARYTKNPTTIHQVALNDLEAALLGRDISDVTSPFMFLLEEATTLSASAMMESESVVRKLYPKLAVSNRDIYRHMSDADYTNAFASPGIAPITLLLPVKELMAAAVSITPSDPTSPRLLVIPTDTKVTVQGKSLGIYYPINIVIANGVIQTFYNLDFTNKLQTKVDNVIPNRIVRMNNVDYLEINVDMFQFSVASNLYVLDGTTVFKNTIPFKDKYYTARAYHSKVTTINGVSGKTWEEISVTHDNLVYDVKVPTVIVSVFGTDVTVTIPDIYKTTNIISNEVRIDIYTTTGVIEIDLSALGQTAFAMNWTNLDTFDKNTYTAPLNNINDLIIYSDGILSGGNNGRTLDELKQLVIYRRGSRHAPIMTGDLEVGLSKLGYTVELLRNTITDRLYIAAKHLAARTVDGLTTNVMCSTVPVVIDTALGLSGNSHDSTVYSHSTNRTTLTPNVVYDKTGADITLYDNMQVDALNNLSAAELKTYLNARQLQFSPFYTVIDYSGRAVESRVYVLDRPRVLGRSWGGNNYSLIANLQYGDVTSITVSVVADYYEITIIASSLIAHNPSLEYSGSTIVGVNTLLPDSSSLVNGGKQYVFRLATKFDVNAHDELIIDNLTNKSNVMVPTAMPLSTKLDLVLNPVGGTLTRETISIEFGTRLNGLYSATKTIAGIQTYQRYLSDVNAVHTTRSYANGPRGKLYNILPDGNVEFVVTHEVGDNLIVDGVQILEHRKGDYILDSNGNPIPFEVPGSSDVRVVNVTMLNIMYKFSTNPEIVAYTKGIAGQIQRNLELEIIPASKQLHERTELFFIPRGYITNTNINIGGGVTVFDTTMVDFNITFYVTALAIDDILITAAIEHSCKEILSSAILSSTISKSDITSRLLKINPEYIVNVNVADFLLGKASIMTLLDKNATFGIPENISISQNGVIDVVDTVVITFKQS